MVRKGLLNRVLPAVLSAAMVFTSVPVSAFAAETPVETASEQNWGGGISQEVAAESEATQTTDEESEDLFLVEDDTSEETLLTSTPAPETTEVTGEESEDTNEANPAVKPVISVKLDSISSALLDEEEGRDGMKVVFNGGKTTYSIDYFRNLGDAVSVSPFQVGTASPFQVDDVKTTAAGDLYNAVEENTSVYRSDAAVVNEYKDGTLKNENLVLQWFKSTDDAGETWPEVSDANAINMDEVANVGHYRLAIYTPASNGYEASDIEYVYFDITQTVVNIVPNKTSYDRGTAASAIIAENSDYTVILNDDDDTSYPAAPFFGGTAPVVKEALTGTAFTGNLDGNANYILSYDVAIASDFAANYTLGEHEFVIQYGDLTPAKLVLGYSSDALIASSVKEDLYDDETDDEYFLYGVKYTYGTAVTTAGLTSAKLVSLEDENVVAVADLLTATEEQGVTLYWIDANGKKLKDAPAETGTYFYVFDYLDPNKNFKAIEGAKLLQVVIESAKVQVKPVYDLTANPVYNLMTAGEVLANVNYEITGVTLTEEEKLGFFGTGYSANGATSQAYYPVFEIQKGTQRTDGEGTSAVTSTVWESLDYDDELENKEGVSYRIAFTGNKALFYPQVQTYWDYDENKWINYNTANEVEINSATTSYEVDVTATTIDATAIAITFTAATASSINVSEMTVKGTAGDATDIGATFAAPAIYEYTGKSIFAAKSEYKKAVVTLGSETINGYTTNPDYELTYDWQKFNDYYLESLFDDDQNASEPALPAALSATATPAEIAAYNEAMKKYDAWEDGWKNSGINGDDDAEGNYHYFDDALNYPAPINKGIYRLKVTFKDKTHKYENAEAFVYYVIRPQTATISTTAALVAYDDDSTTIYDYKNSLQSTDSASADNYLAFDLIGSDGTSLTAKDDFPEAIKSKMTSNPGAFFTAQYKDVDEKKGTSEWSSDIPYPYNYVDVNTEYRLIFDTEAVYVYGVGYYLDNYNFFGDQLGKHNQVKSKGDLTLGVVAITVKETLGTPVLIDFDDAAFTTDIREKVYDGEPFDLDKIKALVTVKNADTLETVSVTPQFNLYLYNNNGTAVPTVENPAYEKFGDEYNDDYPYDVNRWNYTSWKQDSFETTIHGGYYYLEIVVNSDATYKRTSSRVGAWFRIKERKVTISPIIDSEIEAGERFSANNYGNANNLVDGYTVTVETINGKDSVDGDIIGNMINEDTFKWYNYVFEADETPDKDGTSYGSLPTNYFKGYLQSEGSYYIYNPYLTGYTTDPFNGYRKDANGNSVEYSRDYEIAPTDKVSFTPVRASATIESVDTTVSTDITYTTNETTGKREYTTTIGAVTAIPVDQEDDSETKHKNIFKFTLKAPDEFRQANDANHDEDSGLYYASLFYQSDKYKSKGSHYRITDGELLGTAEKDFVFVNKIEAAGGWVESATSNRTSYSYSASAGSSELNAIYDYITVAFDYTAMAEAEALTASFDILWAADYVEHFIVDLSEATYYADLTNAVAPKSIKFNAVTKKMAVGETQQLDVKLTKQLLSDIIWLGYEVIDGAEYLSVTSGYEKEEIADVNIIGKTENSYYDEDGDLVNEMPTTKTATGYKNGGFVTALKAGGTATVEVFPMHEVYKDGELVREKIEGAKSAKVKIKVQDIAAVKLNSAKATDTRVTIKYKQPANGYRREIYVLPGKINVKNFEAQVAAVTNGNYSDFTAVSYLTKWNENSKADAKGVVTTTISGDIEPANQYTVYVRNVSGLRTLDNGNKVAISAKGKVKTFKTTKAQVNSFVLSLDGDDAANDIKETDEILEVDLSQGSVSLKTQGKFMYKYADESADDGDYAVLDLPLSSTYKKSYLAPSVKYLVYDADEAVDYYSWWDNERSCFTTTDQAIVKANGAKNYTAIVGYNGVKTWYLKSALASIDKKGKLTLKGAGNIVVLAYDTKSNTYSRQKIKITATPDAITAKDATIQSGQTVFLSDYLTYTAGGKEIANYTGSYVVDLNGDYPTRYYGSYENPVTYNDVYAYRGDQDGLGDGLDRLPGRVNLSIDKVKDDNFAIEEVKTFLGFTKQGEEIYNVDYAITALKTDAEMTINVSDKNSSAAAVAVNFKSTAPDAVKNAKSTLITDSFAKGTLTHTTNNLGYYIYGEDDVEIVSRGLVEVRDKRDGVVVSNMSGSIAPKYNTISSSSSSSSSSSYYDPKKKVWNYEWNTNGENKLTLTSNYVVELTALGGTTANPEPSAVTKVKIKTRNIAAAPYDFNKKVPLTTVGYGMPVYLMTTGEREGDYAGDYSLNEAPVFRSGNTYTLRAGDEINAARDRQSDKLTWKILNTKVAKVKAKAGSFTAALTAVKPGVTELQLTSKVTKKCIARWTIIVGAVGNGDTYFGTNEPYNLKRGYTYTFAPTTETLDADVLAVTIDNPVEQELQPGTSQWFVFEAPYYGTFAFKYGSKYYDNYGNLRGSSITPYDDDDLDYVTMQKGEKKYLKITDNSYLSNVFAYVQVVKGDKYNFVTASGTTAQKGEEIQYIAPEDNVYTLQYKNYAGEWVDVADTYTIKKSGTQHQDNPKSLAKGEEVSWVLADGSNLVDKRDYEIRITKREPSVIATTTTATEIKDEDTELWYKYTATGDDETVTFTFTQPKDSATVNVYFYDGVYTDEDDNEFDGLYDNTGKTAISYTPGEDEAKIYTKEVSLAKAGDVAYFKVTASDIDEEDDNKKVAKFTVEVKTTETKALVLGDNTGITLEKDGVEKTLSFAPVNTSGKYVVTIKGKGVALADTNPVTVGESKSPSAASELAEYTKNSRINDGTTVLTVVLNLDKLEDDEKLNDEDKIYLTIKTSETTDQAVTINIAERTYVALSTSAATAAQTVEAGQDVYFSFAAPKSANYNFAFTAASTADLTVEEVDVSDELQAVLTGTTANSTTTFTEQKAVTEMNMVYFKVTNNGSASASVTGAQVTSIAYTKIAALNTDYEAKTTAANTTTYYSFQPKEKAWYTFTFENAETVTYSGWKEGEAVSDEELTTGTPTLLFASDSLVFKVVTTGEATVKAKATKRTVTAIKVGKTENLKVAASSDAWYSFETIQDSFYTFKFEGAATDSFTVKAYGSKNSNIDTDVTVVDVTSATGKAVVDENDLLTLNNHIRQKKIVYFRVNNTASTDATLTITIGEPTAIDTKTDGTFTVATANADDVQWFSFKAPATDLYRIVFQGDKGEDGENYSVIGYTQTYTNSESYYYYGLTEYNNHYDSGSGSYVNTIAADAVGRAIAADGRYTELYKNNVYYFGMKPDSDYTDTNKLTGKVTVTRKVTERLDTAASYTISDVELDPQDSNTYKFVAPEEGVWKFTVTYDAAVSTDGTSYTAYANVGGMNQYGKFSEDYKTQTGTQAVDQYGEITITVTNDNEDATKIKYTIKAEKVTPVVITTTGTVSGIAKDEQWFVYTAAEDGVYTFTNKTDKVGYNVYVNNVWLGDSGRTLVLEKGDNIYIKASIYSGTEAEKASGTITVTAASVTALTVDTASDFSVNSSYTDTEGDTVSAVEKWFSFTPAYDYVYGVKLTDVTGGASDDARARVQAYGQSYDINNGWNTSISDLNGVVYASKNSLASSDASTKATAVKEKLSYITYDKDNTPTYYFRVYTTDGGADKAVTGKFAVTQLAVAGTLSTGSATKVKEDKLTLKDGETSASQNVTKYYTFTAPDDLGDDINDSYFRFTAAEVNDGDDEQVTPTIKVYTDSNYANTYRNLRSGTNTKTVTLGNESGVVWSMENNQVAYIEISATVTNEKGYDISLSVENIGTDYDED